MVDPLPENRALIARIGAFTSWANTADRSARTAPARAASPASLDYWERKVDPDGQLSPADRATRAEFARKAHFARLALKSAQARQRRPGTRRPTATGEAG